MPDTRTLLSVGIDVGTTTTQIIFSRITLADVARPGRMPRVSITGREIIYQSPITFTPLLDRDTVDAEKLTAIARREYAVAGVDPRQVETGAVIITGEAAKKKNADAVLAALAGLAGDFVVSVAGPHVESPNFGARGRGCKLRADTFHDGHECGHRRRQRQQRHLPVRRSGRRGGDELRRPYP